MSDHRHSIYKCACGAVISQCRCASKDKPVLVIQQTCPACEGKAMTNSSLPDEIIANNQGQWIADINIWSMPSATYVRKDLDTTRRIALADALEQTVKLTHGRVALEEVIAYLRGTT